MSKKDRIRNDEATSTSVESPATLESSFTTLTLTSKTQKGVSAHLYEVTGRRGIVYIPKTFFANAPATITLPVALDTPTVKVPVAKMTPEQKEAHKQLRKLETPAQKADRARAIAEKAAARAAKLAAAVV